MEKLITVLVATTLLFLSSFVFAGSNQNCLNNSMISCSNNSWNTNCSAWSIDTQTNRQCDKYPLFIKATATKNSTTGKYNILCYYQTEAGLSVVLKANQNVTGLVSSSQSGSWTNYGGKYLCTADKVGDVDYCTFIVE